MSMLLRSIKVYRLHYHYYDTLFTHVHAQQGYVFGRVSVTVLVVSCSVV